MGEGRRYPVDSRVARALDVVGGRWALLIVEVLLGGNRRFGELARELSGIPSNLLVERLRQLERDGVLQRVLAPDAGAVVTYRLTTRGRELRRVITALASWSR